MAVWRKSGFMYVCVGLVRRRLGTLQQILFLFVFFFLTFLSLEYGGGGGGVVCWGGDMVVRGRPDFWAGSIFTSLFPLSHQG